MPSSANKDDRAAASSPGAPLKHDTPPDSVRRAVLSRRLPLFAAIVVAGAALDLGSKHWIFGKLWPPDGRVIWLWPEYVGLELSLNQGALFGIGQGMVWLFATLSVVAAVGIVYWLFVIGEARDLWLCVALALITAGIAGNLYDRLGLHGLRWHPPAVAPDVEHDNRSGRIYAVRDWILLQYGRQRWPNFNVADSLLVCGAGMLLLQLTFGQRRMSPPGRTSVPS